MADHYRMHLNNFLQSRGMANQLTWNVSSDGPPHNAMWRAVAFVRGVQYGDAYSRTRNAACEEAARQALATLQSR